MKTQGLEMHLASTILILTCLLLPFQTAIGQWSPPKDLKKQVDTLNEEQVEFLTSGAVLQFLPQQQLEHELSTRDTESLLGLLNDLMALSAEMSYDPERDMGATPLNIHSKRFNRGTLPTPPLLRKMERDPGPFSVHRYLFPQTGVPTFAGAKVAIWPEDLVAGKVDVAIIGVPSNAGSGRRDANHGPNEMRATNTIVIPDVQSLIKPDEVLSLADYGDFSVDWLATELSIAHVTDMVAETAETGAIPMLVGGDTSMLYPGVKGVARARGSATFGLLQLNAHPDAERFGDHTVSDRQSMFLLLDEGIVNGGDTIQVGLRGPEVDVETLQWLRDQKVRYHTMAEIQQRGFDNVLKRVISEVDKGPDAFFVSIDVSVISPTDMQAAGRMTPNGLRAEEVAQAIRHVCAAKEIVGFEITDLAPMLDLSRLSVLNANSMLNACLIGIALRKNGLRPEYVHPLALDHGQR
ncbi:MAG: arginase family protein [Xanthomonadales bacterium]|nr:arginase family protein [Xanthomonadales bacterium]